MNKQSSYLTFQCYKVNDCEFNLAADKRKTIIRAFGLYPTATQAQIAHELGTTPRTLSRMIKMLHINIKLAKEMSSLHKQSTK